MACFCASEPPGRTESKECLRSAGRLLSNAIPMLWFTSVWVKTHQIWSRCENKVFLFHGCWCIYRLPQYLWGYNTFHFVCISKPSFTERGTQRWHLSSHVLSSKLLSLAAPKQPQCFSRWQKFWMFLLWSICHRRFVSVFPFFVSFQCSSDTHVLDKTITKSKGAGMHMLPFAGGTINSRFHCVQFKPGHWCKGDEAPVKGWSMSLLSSQKPQDVWQGGYSLNPCSELLVWCCWVRADPESDE